MRAESWEGNVVLLVVEGQLGSETVSISRKQGEDDVGVMECGS